MRRSKLLRSPYLNDVFSINKGGKQTVSVFARLSPAKVLVIVPTWGDGVRI